MWWAWKQLSVGSPFQSPEESFQVGQPCFPVGSLQKTAFPAPVGSDVASALFPERHLPLWDRGGYEYRAELEFISLLQAFG